MHVKAPEHNSLLVHFYMLDLIHEHFFPLWF